MPNIQYPHKSRPGYVAARRCTAPCGGWVVVFDRKGGGPEGIQGTIKETGRWILQHDPSGRWAGLDKKEDALLYMKAVAKGEDAEVGILPATVPPMKETEILHRTKKKQAKEGKAASAPSEGDSPRVREAEVGLPPPGSAPAPPAPPAAALPGALVFQRTLDERFPADYIADGLEEGLKAEKAYVTNGQLVYVPDHASRSRYYDMLLKYRIGIADKREKPTEPKRVTMTELETMVKRSPAARRALRKMVDDAEEEAAATPS